MTWLKICGTTSLTDAELSVSFGADALGFIFAESPRRIDLVLAAEIIGALPAEVEKIGVFVSESPARVGEIAARVGLTGAQLQGDESAEQLAEFRKALGDRRIIQTVQASRLLGEGLDGWASNLGPLGNVDAVLLDSGSAAKLGGTGIPFDWEKALPQARTIQSFVPLIIAGGLNPQNVGEALRLFHPWGIDVVSGVEREPGKKDEVKLREFIAAVRQQPAG
ncbi:MAG: phosphoribosylanthranilate isomerase [Candidatus Korobacteraceae bacterium]